MDTANEYRYKRAKERVDCIKGFYGNLLAYLIIMPLLVYLNYKTSSFPWVIFPAIGWGMGLLVNGLHAFDRNPLFGRSWEERKLKEFMNDEQF